MTEDQRKKIETEADALEKEVMIYGYADAFTDGAAYGIKLTQDELQWSLKKEEQLKAQLSEVQKKYDELLSYLPKVPTQPYEKELAKQLQLERERSAKLVEALNRIVGMVEVWTDEHGQRKTEEIYASKIAREALAAYEKGEDEGMLSANEKHIMNLEKIIKDLEADHKAMREALEKLANIVLDELGFVSCIQSNPEKNCTQIARACLKGLRVKEAIAAYESEENT